MHVRWNLLPECEVRQICNDCCEFSSSISLRDISEITATHAPESTARKVWIFPTLEEKAKWLDRLNAAITVLTWWHALTSKYFFYC